MEFQLIRHATLLLTLNNKKMLVDPILNPRGSMEPVEEVPNQNLNPLVELPIPIDTIVDCDAIFVTHCHRDHFNEETAKLLPKNVPLFCQLEDEDRLQKLEFTDVRPVKDLLIWEDMKIIRTNGRHGYGLTAIKMAPVSGFFLSVPGEPSVYIAGDTVWCSCTQTAIETYLPDIIICNCGEATFATGKPITMDRQNVLSVCNSMPSTKVIAVHMEAWNHCRLTRKELREFIISNGIQHQVLVPEDGEKIMFNRYKTN